MVYVDISNDHPLDISLHFLTDQFYLGGTRRTPWISDKSGEHSLPLYHKLSLSCYSSCGPLSNRADSWVRMYGRLQHELVQIHGTKWPSSVSNQSTNRQNKQLNSPSNQDINLQYFSEEPIGRNWSLTDSFPNNPRPWCACHSMPDRSGCWEEVSFFWCSWRIHSEIIF
jgi:hypothetical protein